MNEELKARLDAARARKSAADAKRDEQEKEASALAEVEAAELEAADAEAVADAVSKYGELGSKIAVVPTSLGCVIVKRPTGAAFRKFQDQAKFDSNNTERFVRPCIVFPDANRIDRIFEEQPATLALVANAVCELAGMRGIELGGK